MSLLCILATAGRNNVDAYAAERLGVLERLRAEAGNKEAAGRCFMVVAEGGCGSGYAYEAPDAMAARSREPKVTAYDGPTNQVYCVAHSKLLRTAQLAGIMQWMGMANDMQNPNFVPPSDAELMQAYYNKMVAKQRWQKAGNALGALRMMRMAGLGGLMPGGAKAPESPAAAVDETPTKRQPRHSVKVEAEQAASVEKEEMGTLRAPDSPTESPVHPRVSQSMTRQQRMSVSFVQNDTKASGLAKKAMAALPKSRDVREVLRSLLGPWCLCIIDVRKEYILAAVSDECTVELLAGVAPDGTIFFGTEQAAMPDNCTIMEVPKGTYYLGRYNGNGDDDLIFRRFAKVKGEDVAHEGDHDATSPK